MPVAGEERVRTPQGVLNVASDVLMSLQHPDRRRKTEPEASFFLTLLRQEKRILMEIGFRQ